jgi:hypothetical protein
MSLQVEEYITGIGPRINTDNTDQKKLYRETISLWSFDIH